MLTLGIICFLAGAGLAVLGFLVEMIFDLGAGEVFMKIGLSMMLIPFLIGLFVIAFVLLLSLFGLVVLI